MKKILITGANSYIGTSFEKYIKENYPNDYCIDTVDMIDGSWRKKSFAGYDSVFHAAGIVHQKETKKNAYLYYKVNRDLAIETAKKAKDDGVKQFVFLSSMSVYGMDTGVITKETTPKPKSHYGKSKLQAEQAILSIVNDGFAVCILRPPMVYGNSCKGNFQTVVKIVKKLPFFPKVKNKRSMIYVDNLSSFVKHCVDDRLDGVYFPQNKQYMCTSDMAQWISEKIQKKIYLDFITGMCVRFLSFVHPTAKKAFGSLIYNIEDDRGFCVIAEEDSVKESVTI